MFELAQLNKEL